MNKRIENKLRKKGLLPEKKVPQATWEPRFPIEHIIIPLYLSLQERDPAHHLLAYGAVDDNHFKPSHQFWNRVNGEPNRQAQYEPIEHDGLSMISYALQLRIAARTIEEQRSAQEPHTYRIL